ncbi:hypothetical protein Ddye_024499 [Dipteronia dyeriana]|uniref:Uncharacterized protein n=1 Tax=Dipteronia dyeriana TaxID=168575 RepID=A0AAD9WTN3_9ROSI|nr:hypothetical protein Ddye_024499 [Dipteronia dyeriana]
MIGPGQAPLEPRRRIGSGGFDEHKLQKVIAEASLDFYEWTSLISDIENLFPDDIHKICLVNDAFLAEFPLCYAYWRKYAEVLNTRQGCAPLIRCLKYLNKPCNLQHILLVCGLTIVALACRHLKILMISVGNVNAYNI